MEILTVKIQGHGYLLNGSMHVPKADGNREYDLIKQWLAKGNTPEPEFTAEELAKQELQIKIQEALVYLNNTDWYVTRFTETGKEIPEEVTIKRAEARALYKEI